MGVDIFFVISGYLITSIIAKDEESGKFSIVSFYDRRIRRIFPALFGVIFFSTVVSAVLLAPSDFAFFGKSLLAITCFASNIFFERTGGRAGYFAADAHSQVLLHTWSLSVEEQFYLFFPTFLVIVTRLAKRYVCEVLLVVITVSFAINIWATQHRPPAAFYLLLPRAWELLLGAILATKVVPPLKRRMSREIAGFAGLGLIVWAVLVITTDSAFPGAWALLPCLGAWLIVYAGQNGPSYVRTILSFRPLVFVGVISYSLYLWHWPIIVFAKILSGGEVSDFSRSEITGVIVLSLLMAVISFEFIESPFRGGTTAITRRQIFSFGLATSALSVAVGFSIYFSGGFPGRFNEATNLLISKNLERKTDYEDVCGNWKKQIKSAAELTVCNIGESSPKIMFWGDSHVQQLYPAIRQIYDSAKLQGHGVVFTVAPGCPPMEHMNRSEPGYHCETFSHFAMIRAEQDDVDVVFIGFSVDNLWTVCRSVDDRCLGKISEEEMLDQFFDGLATSIRTLKTHGKRIILSLPFPSFDKSPPDFQVRNAVLGMFRMPRPPADTSPASARNRLTALAEQMGVEIFDPRKSLCRDRDCLTEVDGVSIYRDRSHLAASQVGILADNLENTLRRALPAQ